MLGIYAFTRYRWLAIYLLHISPSIIAQLCVRIVNVESLTQSLAPHRMEFNLIIVTIYSIHSQHIHTVCVVLGTCTLVKATRRKHHVLYAWDPWIFDGLSSRCHAQVAPATAANNQKLNVRLTKRNMRWIKMKTTVSTAHKTHNISCVSKYFYARNSPPPVIAHRKSGCMAGILIKLIKIYAWQRCFATNANRYIYIYISACNSAGGDGISSSSRAASRAVKDILRRKILLRVETWEGKVHIIILWHQPNHLNKFSFRHWELSFIQMFKLAHWWLGKQHPLRSKLKTTRIE